MAQEISVTARLQATKDSVKLIDAGSAAAVRLDLTGEHAADQTVTVPEAADVQLPIPGEITTIGLLYVKNLDAANFIELSYDTGVNFAANVFAKVRAGFPLLMQPSSATIYAKADTADVRIQRAVLPE